MADHTAPVVKRAHNSYITGPARVRRHFGARHGGQKAIIWQKQALPPLNGPIMRQNKAYQAIFCTWKLLPVLYFYFRLCDPTLQLTENDLWPSRTCKQGNHSPLTGILRLFSPFGSIMVAKTTSSFISARTVWQYEHGLLLQSPFGPFSADCWPVRAKIRQKRPPWWP